MPPSNERPADGWRKVVFSSQCDEDGNCPVCAIDYAECDCPGPTMEDEYDYRTVDGDLYARRKNLVIGSGDDNDE